MSTDHVSPGEDTEHHEPHAHPLQSQLSPYAVRAYAIRDLLLEKGLLSQEDLRSGAEYFNRRGLTNGATLVARAWVDVAFKQRLLVDAKAACEELGLDTAGFGHLVVLENTPALRHLVVCTLCSCYPRPLLGLPPDWYKSLSYRARAVKEPRIVMREFGDEPTPDEQVKVFDSSADIRYLVLPLRPAGTEGLTEQELAEIVTRDSLIGVTQPRYHAAREVAADG
jgi:nitrile hydratase